MAKRKMKTKKLTLAKPTTAFNRAPKKPEKDDRPGPMQGGRQPGGLAKHAKRKKSLAGVMI